MDTKLSFPSYLIICLQVLLHQCQASTTRQHVHEHQCLLQGGNSPESQAMLTEMLPVALFANGCVLHVTAPTDESIFLY